MTLWASGVLFNHIDTSLFDLFFLLFHTNFGFGEEQHGHHKSDKTNSNLVTIISLTYNTKE